MDFDIFDDEMMMMEEPSGLAGGRKHVIFSDDLEAGSSRLFFLVPSARLIRGQVMLERSLTTLIINSS